MIKIGNEKLFSQTEILENLRAYLKADGITIYDLERGGSVFEILAVAATIGESADFVRGFVTSRKEG